MSQATPSTTNDVSSYKPSYILVVSDEGCWRGENFSSQNARFQQLLGKPETGEEKLPQTVQDKIKFFTDFELAKQFMEEELAKGRIPHTLFLDMFIKQKNKTSPCTEELCKILTDKGIKRPYYTMSSNISDFNTPQYDEYRSFINGAKALTLDKPDEIINRILGAASDLDLHRMHEKTGREGIDHMANDNRRIILATNDKAWIKQLRNNVHFFDRFVLVCESQASFYETLKYVTNKKRNIISMVVDENLPPGKDLHYTPPAGARGSEVLRHLAEDADGQKMMLNYIALQHTNPKISLVSTSLAQKNYASSGVGRAPLTDDELCGLGIQKKSKIWKINPIQHGDIGQVRDGVQAIWNDYVQSIGDTGLLNGNGPKRGL